MNRHPMPSLRTSPRQHACCLLVIVLLCSACASSSVKESEAPDQKTVKESKPATRPVTPAGAPAALDKAEQELVSGIASYENGAYKLASRQLQSALALGLATGAERAQAHKYLAFMHCVGGRDRLCRNEFRKALDADQGFDLSAAEAGHPTWGPVFRKLKAAGKATEK